MKTFKEYLTESKKVYTFKVKVAGEIPEGFQDQLKESLVSLGEIKVEKEKSTPIQAVPLDFPDLKNQEVHIFAVMTEYPITPPELTNKLVEMGLTQDRFIIRNSMDPSEVDQITKDEIVAGENTLLTNTNYEEIENAKTEEYFGEEHKNSFLKDLETAKKEQEKQQKDNDFGHPLTVDKPGK